MSSDAVLIQLLQQCIPVVEICTKIVLPYTIEPKIICYLWLSENSLLEKLLEASVRGLLDVVDHLCICNSNRYKANLIKTLQKIFLKLDRFLPYSLCSYHKWYNPDLRERGVRAVLRTSNPKYIYVMRLEGGEILHSRSSSTSVLSPFNDVLEHDLYVGNFYDDVGSVTVRDRFLIRSTLLPQQLALDRQLWKHHYICSGSVAWKQTP